MSRQKKTEIIIINMAKEHPIILIAALVTIFLFFYYIVPWGWRAFYSNYIFPQKIYLKLVDGDKKIPITTSGAVIPISKKIEKDKSVSFKFLLSQENVAAPKITNIFVNFPITAEVKPQPTATGWTWMEKGAVLKVPLHKKGRITFILKLSAL